MILPILSENGTPKEKLIADLQATAVALSSAYVAILKTKPNINDYGAKIEIITGVRHNNAVNEYLEQTRKIRNLQAEIEKMIDLISEMEKPQ